MLKKIEVTTTTYQCINVFFVDIVQYGNKIEAWLYHRAYGVKSFMFGIKDATMDEMISMVKAELDGYMQLYEEDYMF